MRILIAIFCFTVMFIPNGFAQAPAEAHAANPELTLIPTKNPTLFRVEFHNPGPEDLVLIMGIALANGSKQYVDAVRYTLKMPDGGVLHLESRGPGLIAGRVDPLVLPLPAGATFSFPIDLVSCSATQERVWELHFLSGHYSLQAQYSGRGITQPEANLDVKGIALMPFWSGSVVSKAVSFTIP
jgi:hypothetical protein